MIKICGSGVARAAFLPLLFSLAAPAHGMGMMDGRGMGMMGGSTVRHSYFMRHGLDPRYTRMTNPLTFTPTNISKGKALYEQNCAACHGATGRGDGVAGANLQPPPADLTSTVRMPMASDGYLYWAISEGGTALNTAMPPWKDILSESDIWHVILYLRTL